MVRYTPGQSLRWYSFHMMAARNGPNLPPFAEFSRGAFGFRQLNRHSPLTSRGSPFHLLIRKSSSWGLNSVPWYAVQTEDKRGQIIAVGRCAIVIRLCFIPQMVIGCMKPGGAERVSLSAAMPEYHGRSRKQDSTS